MDAMRPTFQTVQQAVGGKPVRSGDRWTDLQLLEGLPCGEVAAGWQHQAWIEQGWAVPTDAAGVSSVPVQERLEQAQLALAEQGWLVKPATSLRYSYATAFRISHPGPHEPQLVGELTGYGDEVVLEMFGPCRDRDAVIVGPTDGRLTAHDDD